MICSGYVTAERKCGTSMQMLFGVAQDAIFGNNIFGLFEARWGHPQVEANETLNCACRHCKAGQSSV
jgi:hypothetical protein